MFVVKNVHRILGGPGPAPLVYSLLLILFLQFDCVMCCLLCGLLLVSIIIISSIIIIIIMILMINHHH